MMKSIEIVHTLKQSLVLTLIAMVALLSVYLVAEPRVGQAIYDQFTISQTVTAEISFLATANNVTMSPSLAGITGGTSNGSTQVRVMTNNATGYSMSITASSSPALQGNSQGGEFQDYTEASAGTPDFTFSVGSNTAEFAYSVKATTTSDVDPTFRDNGTDTCATGSSNTAGACWYNLSTSPETIINRATETPASGATTTIFFRAQITANPSPAVPADTYVATTTLTAVTN